MTNNLSTPYASIGSLPVGVVAFLLSRPRSGVLIIAPDGGFIGTLLMFVRMYVAGTAGRWSEFEAGTDSWEQACKLLQRDLNRSFQQPERCEDFTFTTGVIDDPRT